MPHRRLLVGTGFAFLCVASAAGCFSGQSGDPGAGFSSGTGNYRSGYAGTYGAGTAGATGAGTAGATVSMCTGAAGAAGAGASGATDAGATDASATDAKPSTEGGTATEGGAVTEGGAATEGGTVTEGGAATDAATEAAAGAPASSCPAGGTATFAFTWSLEDATGMPSSCGAVGGETVVIQTLNAATCAVTSTTVPCSALAATTCALPAGTYSVSIKLRDATGNVLSEIFAPTLFLDDGEASTVASLPLQVGGDTTKGRGFALTWSLEQAGTTMAETCAQAGAATVRLFAGTTMFDLPCGDGMGRTTEIAPGTYPVSMHLLDASGNDVSVTQTMSVSIAAGQLVFLGDVPFDI